MKLQFKENIISFNSKIAHVACKRRRNNGFTFVILSSLKTINVNPLLIFL
jgi:hypothetical protein